MLSGNVLVAPNVVKFSSPSGNIITIVTMLHYCAFCFVFDVLLQCMLIVPGKISCISSCNPSLYVLFKKATNRI